MKKTSALAITIALLGLVWVLAVVAYTILLELPWLCWGSITCTLVAIIAAEIYLLALRKNSGAPDIILTIGFLLITVLLNSVCVLLKYGNFNWLLLTLNLFTLVCYIISLLWASISAARLARQMAETEQKATVSVHIGRKLGELLAITEDTEIRDRLLKLKEAVDYGTNISACATAEKENQMEALLDELAQLTIAHADRLILLNKVKAVEITWKTRGSTASSVR